MNLTPHPDQTPPAPTGGPADGQVLQFGLRLRRNHPSQGWSAELTMPGMSGRLLFPDLAALSRWLARTEAPPGGLR
jgi:hypothetical protein